MRSAAIATPDRLPTMRLVATYPKATGAPSVCIAAAGKRRVCKCVWPTLAFSCVRPAHYAVRRGSLRSSHSSRLLRGDGPK
jgi:hypothetical protein